MENNCFIQSLVGEVSDKKMAGYLQVADFSEVLIDVGYENGKYWKDNEEAKANSAGTCAINPITLPYIRNGIIIRSKDADYEIRKVSAKVNSVYAAQDVAFTDVCGIVTLYITIRRTDLQPIVETLIISDIVEIVTQAPSMCPYLNNPLIEANYVLTSGSSEAFYNTPIGGYILLNFADSNYPYKLVRKSSTSTLKSPDSLQEKTVKYNDKYYRFNGSVWEEF